MERSRFNTIVEVDPSTCLAFNHTRGKLPRISPKIHHYLEGDNGVRLTRQQREILTEKGFLVTSRQTELSYVRHQTYGFHYNQRKVGYSVILTYE